MSACRRMDDPRRWLIAALSDTGARLRELQGMEQADVFLDAPIPYVHIRANSTRRLKTDESDRQVPLLGEALWAVRRAMESASEHLFPSLLPKVTGADFDSGGVSASLGKWLRENGLAGRRARASVCASAREVELSLQSHGCQQGKSPR